ncbi:MAG: 23S rRNA (pseudouridine(1915)-N(3))-methyltransferase RlmH [bacterium]
MHIRIIGVGKIKEDYLRAGIKEYCKRLSSYCRLEIIEVEDEKTNERASRAEEELVKDKEAGRILRHIKEDTYLIVLDLGGKEFSSEKLAGKMEQLALSGYSDLTFVIGGSLGISPAVRNKADLLLSFSHFTFPHQLMRLILLEQIYRVYRINRGEPYHK